MIRRETGDEFFLIRQDDHAKLSADLAAHLGNDQFALPDPLDKVVQAIALHDSGWPLHDDQPTLNAQGRPPDVFETPPSIALKVWTASAQRAAEADPYAGLLVSLHGLALSVQLVGLGLADNQFGRFDFNKFQHREVERQEQLRRTLGFGDDLPLTHGLAEPHASGQEDQLTFNFRILQAMDWISLCLCCTHPPAQKFDNFLTGPGSSLAGLNARRDERGILSIAPWPFDVPSIELNVPYRALPARRYSEEAEFLNLLTAAPTRALPFVVVGG